MVDRTQEVDLDNWLLQHVDGTTKYGNGTGDIITLGPAANANPDNPMLKGRGIFRIPLATIHDGLTSLSVAEFELTVNGTSCSGTRGSTLRLFCEKLTGSFDTEKSASGDCGFNSGTGTNCWPGPNATTTDRATFSHGSVSSGDKITFNILAIAQAALAAGDAYLYLRVLAGNSGLTAYEEDNAARRLQVYSRNDATAGNRPLYRVTGATTTVAKNDSDTMTLSETENVTQTGTTPGDSDTMTLTDDEVYYGPVAAWHTETDPNNEDNGVGEVSLPLGINGANILAGQTAALLESVSVGDILMEHRFSFDKIPENGRLYWRMLGRVIDLNNCYRVQVSFSDFQSMDLAIQKIVGGALEIMASTYSLQTAIVGQYYRLKFLISGTSPTVLAAKLWREDSSEPAAYQLTGQDAEAVLQADGAIGLAAGMLGGDNLPLTVMFDDFSGVEV